MKIPGREDLQVYSEDGKREQVNMISCKFPVSEAKYRYASQVIDSKYRIPRNR
jgi:hypothetical protein